MGKWALISQKFLGRTQHSIKNRFICLIDKYSSIKREKIRAFMKGKDISYIVKKLLEEMKLQKISEKDIFKEKSGFSKENQKEEDKKNLDYSFENAINVLFGNDVSMSTKNEEDLSDLFHSPYY